MVPASERIGAGNQDRAVAVQRPRGKSVSSFARSVSPTHCGAHHGFMASFSSSASTSDKSPLQSIWRGGRRPPSQGWKTFLHNHADGIASMALFVVPTISFRLLYGLLILHHDRRQILWLGVTAHPTAEWISHQLTEAYGWKG